MSTSGVMPSPLPPVLSIIMSKPPKSTPEFSTEEKRNATVILNRIARLYPDVGTALDYSDAWQLLVATVLSAQTTDESVNKVLPFLFSAYPTAGISQERIPRL